MIQPLHFPHGRRGPGTLSPGSSSAAHCPSGLGFPAWRAPRGAARRACRRPGAAGPRRRLTSVALAGRAVEGEPQRDDGGDFQNDQRHVLQGLPHELQEGLWPLRRYEVSPKNLLPLLQVWSGAWQTCGQSAERLAWGSWGDTHARESPRGGRPCGRGKVRRGERQKQGRKLAGTHQEPAPNASFDPEDLNQCAGAGGLGVLLFQLRRTRGPTSTLIDKLTHHRV